MGIQHILTHFACLPSHRAITNDDITKYYSKITFYHHNKTPSTSETTLSRSCEVQVKPLWGPWADWMSHLNTDSVCTFTVLITT